MTIIRGSLTSFLSIHNPYYGSHVYYVESQGSLVYLHTRIMRSIMNIAVVFVYSDYNMWQSDFIFE